MQKKKIDLGCGKAGMCKVLEDRGGRSSTIVINPEKIITSVKLGAKRGKHYQIKSKIKSNQETEADAGRASWQPRSPT